MGRYTTPNFVVSCMQVCKFVGPWFMLFAEKYKFAVCLSQLQCRHSLDLRNTVIYMKNPPFNLLRLAPINAKPINPMKLRHERQTGRQTCSSTYMQENYHYYLLNETFIASTNLLNETFIASTNLLNETFIASTNLLNETFITSTEHTSTTRY